MICESTQLMPKSLTSQSTMNGFLKFRYARVIVFANATLIVVKVFIAFRRLFKLPYLRNNLLSSFTMCAKFLINFL